MSEPHHLFDLVYREPEDANDMPSKPDTWTVMRWLEERRVCVFVKVDDGFVAAEKCDNFFHAPLTREHLLQLAEELKQLAEGA